MRLAHFVCFTSLIYIGILAASTIQLGCSAQQTADFQKTHDMAAIGEKTAALPAATVQAVAGNPAPLFADLFDLGKLLLAGTAGATAHAAVKSRARAGKQERRTDRSAPTQPTPPPTTTPPLASAAFPLPKAA